MNETSAHERILIEGLKEGNTKIFDYLFHYYYSSLVVFSSKIVENKVVAEDIVQDFFLKLWLNRKEIVILQSVKNYFFSSVKNRSLDFVKRKKIGERVDNEIGFIHAGDVSKQYDLLTESELESMLNKALEKLPEKCKKIFIMNRFDGIKPAEIAKLEKISVRTVEGHIGKAIRVLRAELEPFLPLFLVLMLLKNS